jgi:hypothetical protein
MNIDGLEIIKDPVVFRGFLFQEKRNQKEWCLIDIPWEKKLQTDNQSVWSSFLEYQIMDFGTTEKELNLAEWPITQLAKNELLKYAKKIVKETLSYNVGVFWTKTHGSSLGGHFDDDQVYTFQLFGEKKWVIDSQNLDRLLSLIKDDKVQAISNIKDFNSSETWVRAKGKSAIEFQNPNTVILQPGDLLITPAYSLHKVTSVSEKTLSMNIGVCMKNKIPNTNILYTVT